MSMFIIEGNNNGYPCIPELTNSFAVIHKAPFWDFSMKLSDTLNNGYPVMIQTPVPARTPDMKPVFPDFYMHCLGEEFNCGYPCILKLENISRSVFSHLFFNNHHVSRLFFGSEEPSAAYCNGRKVYGRTYIQHKSQLS